MLSHPLPKRFTDVASLAIGVNLAVQAVLAGAPFDESLLGGLIAGVGVFLVYTVARTGSLPGASVSARQALRRPATRRVAGATAAAAGVLLLVVGFAPDAEARTRCSYAGPPANTLTVTVSGEGIGVIRRQGPEITAGEFLAGPGACSGGTPTVLNTDTISVLLGPEAFADLELAGGPFAPGATVETEGASEIEVQFSGAGSLANIVGTSRGDEFHWGNGGAHAGLNLNPRTALDKDVDVTTRGNLAFLVADGAGGRDTIIGEPGALVRDLVFAEGGRGNVS